MFKLKLNKKKTNIVQCMNCNIFFSRYKKKIKKKIFCTINCSKEYHSRPDTCIGCGKKYVKKNNKGKTNYCSWDCFKASRWKIVKCEECGIDFNKRISEIKKSNDRRSKHLCSRDCRNSYTSKFLGGNGTWVKGGRYKPKNRGRDWRRNRLLALKRDDFTCQQCGDIEKLEVHHWEPYEITNDNSLDNLVTLCNWCHKMKHLEYISEGFYQDVINSGFYN